MSVSSEEFEIKKPSRDLLLDLIKDNEFLGYKHKIKQVSPADFIFSLDAEHTEVTGFSDFGLDVIRDFLHIGFINRDEAEERCPILLTVWPSFVSPDVYEDSETYLSEIEKVNTLIFYVPERVYRNFYESNPPLDRLLVATSVLKPVDEWKYLERQIVTSFYNSILNQSTPNSLDTSDVWTSYSAELNTKWKQIIFLCCGPPDVALSLKKMLKRNSARIARKAVSAEDYKSSGYELFSDGNVFVLLVEWAKYTTNHDGMLSFLNEVNTTKPSLMPLEIMDKLKTAFATDVINSEVKPTVRPKQDGNVGKITQEKRRSITGTPVAVNGKFRCEECPYTTARRCMLTRHLRKHSGEKPFGCEICDKTFSSAWSLKVHVQTHSDDKPFDCDNCDKSFKNAKTLKAHSALHEVILENQCKYCGKEFTQKAQCQVHTARHEVSKQIKFECHSCKEEFKNEIYLKEHMLTHTKDKNFQCLVCLKWFDSKSELKKHSSTHTVEKPKPFSCDICGKAFLRKYHLVQHAAVHRAPAFKCEYCPKAFTRDCARVTHQLSVHKDKY